MSGLVGGIGAHAIQPGNLDIRCFSQLFLKAGHKVLPPPGKMRVLGPFQQSLSVAVYAVEVHRPEGMRYHMRLFLSPTRLRASPLAGIMAVEAEPSPQSVLLGNVKCLPLWRAAGQSTLYSWLRSSQILEARCPS